MSDPKRTPGLVEKLVLRAVWSSLTGGSVIPPSHALREARALAARPVLDEAAVAAMREWLRAYENRGWRRSGTSTPDALVAHHLRRLLPPEEGA